MICVVTESIFELLIPLIMADIVDVGVANGDKAYIFAKGGQMLLCAFMALVLGIGSARFSALCGQGLGARLRRKKDLKLQSFSFANIDHFRVSSLVTRLTSDVTNIQNAVSSGLRPACRGPVMLVIATGVAFFINTQLAMVFLVALPVLGILLFLIISHVRPFIQKCRAPLIWSTGLFQSAPAIRVVKAYVRGDYEVGKFEQVNQNLKVQSEKAFRLSAINMPAMQLVILNDFKHFMVWRKYDSDRKYGDRKTDRIFKLCPADFKFIDDDFQCIYDAYKIPCFRHTYYGDY